MSNNEQTFDSSYRPSLRGDLQISVPREDVIVLVCPLGLSEPLILKSAVGPLLAKCTGEHTLAHIAAQFSSYGLTQTFLVGLMQILDQHALLLGPSFESRRQAAQRTFLESPVRKAAFAGRGYAAEPTALQEEIEAYLGRQPLSNAGAPSDLRLLVAPHIDYGRGGDCYGLTFQALRSCEPELVILVGTAHQYSPLLFHLTSKDFETPFGIAKTDRLFVRELLRNYGEELVRDEIVHAREHSLELQLPFLKHLCPRARIVPILVGSFHRMLNSSPSQFPEYERFADHLTTILLKRWAKEKTIILAGVDMAHVGRHFGDDESLSPAGMQRIAERDQSYIQALLGQDKAALFSHIGEDEDARRICGYPSLYLALDVLDRLGAKLEMRLFDYRQAVDYQSDCAVTFAGIGGYTTRNQSLS